MTRLLTISFPLGLLACSEQKLGTVDDSPEVSITSHSDGDVALEGEIIRS
jgi:hypothetical protein